MRLQRILDIFINIFVLIQSVVLMVKIYQHDKENNGLKTALLTLFSSIIVNSLWAIYVLIRVKKIYLSIIIWHTLSQSLRLYAIESVDKELFDDIRD